MKILALLFIGAIAFVVFAMPRSVLAQTDVPVATPSPPALPSP